MMLPSVKVTSVAAQPEEVPSDKARHWKGTLEVCLQEYVSKKSATEFGDDSVTQKKKS